MSRRDHDGEQGLVRPIREKLELLLRFHEATGEYYRALRVRHTLLLARLDRARLEALSALLTAVLGRPPEEGEVEPFRL